MVTDKKLHGALTRELLETMWYMKQADIDDSEETRKEDLLQAVQHNARAGAFADILRKDYGADTAAAVGAIQSDARQLRDLICK